LCVPRSSPRIFADVCFVILLRFASNPFFFRSRAIPLWQSLPKLFSPGVFLNGRSNSWGPFFSLTYANLEGLPPLSFESGVPPCLYPPPFLQDGWFFFLLLSLKRDSCLLFLLTRPFASAFLWFSIGPRSPFLEVFFRLTPL